MTNTTGNAEGGATASTLELFAAETPRVKAGKGRETQHIPLVEIEMDPDQPRKELDSELEESLKREGLIQSITVRLCPDPVKVKQGIKYRIVDGARRYLAAVKAGFTTIEAFVEEDKRSTERVRRLIRQLAANEHRRLAPLEEAETLAEVQRETGMSIGQLAEVSGRKKSTVAERLALANAPKPFQALFLSGALSASVGAHIGRYADVPLSILKEAAELALHDLAWADAIRAGKPVPLRDVERVLEQLILVERLELVTEAMALYYGDGPIVKVAGIIYATDLERFGKAKREQQKAEKLAAQPPFKPGDKSAAGEAPKGGATLELVSEKSEGGAPPAEAPRLAPSEKKRQDADRAEKVKRDSEAKAFIAAQPEILAAIGKAIQKAPTDSVSKLGKYLIERMFDAIGFDNMAAGKFVARGATAADLTRHLVMCLIHAGVTSGDWTPATLPTTLARIGIEIDLRALIAKASADVAKGGPKLVPTKSAPKAKSKTPPKAKPSKTVKRKR